MIDLSIMKKIRDLTCPACGYHVAVPFFDGGLKPLATLAWPKSMEEAQAIDCLPLDFYRCVECSHVFNASFEYKRVPYSDKPNKMYNRGAIWAEFIREIQQKILSFLPPKSTVVEIGHGDGSFLRALADLAPESNYIGFDPHGSVQSTNQVEFRNELFEPSIHMEILRPTLVISRHVLEHLLNPLVFLQNLSFAAACLDLEVTAYFEVPCIDRAIETRRIVDFYYEHSSQFTTRSFQRMLARCGAKIEIVDRGYEDEVIYGIIRLGVKKQQVEHAAEAASFYQTAMESRARICAQLDRLFQSGKHVAIWGGTGKSAAFINHYRADADRFPIVVDSDSEKAGTYVPGSGQLIRFRDYLLECPADVIIIPPQWRAKDILLEMTATGIHADCILIEDRGALVHFPNGLVFTGI